MQAVSAVAAEDGVRFMQEMMELSSQQQKEQLPPRAIQIVSHPFYGRVVLTAGPAQFGTDLSKSSTGVCIQKKPLYGHFKKTRTELCRGWSLKHNAVPSGPSTSFLPRAGARLRDRGRALQRLR